MVELSISTNERVGNVTVEQLQVSVSGLALVTPLSRRSDTERDQQAWSKVYSYFMFPISTFLPYLSTLIQTRMIILYDHNLLLQGTYNTIAFSMAVYNEDDTQYLNLVTLSFRFDGIISLHLYQMLNTWIEM